MDDEKQTTPDKQTEAPVEFPEHGSVIEGTDGKERIVHDENGWHKEALGEDE